MADKSKNNSKFKSSSILDDISALHNINKPKNSRATGSEYETLAAAFLEQNLDIQLLQETIEPDMVRLI